MIFPRQGGAAKTHCGSDLGKNPPVRTLTEGTRCSGTIDDTPGLLLADADSKGDRTKQR